MKHLKPSYVSVLLCALTLLAGCANTPVQNLTLAYRSYAAAERVANDLRDQGAITEAQHESLRPTRNAARAALVDWQQAVADGNTDAVSVAESAFTKALSAFTDATAAEKSKARPTTQPTTQPETRP